MYSQLLEVQSERDGNRVRVRVAGEIDLATAPQLATRCRQHMAREVERVELDLRAVGFIDSTGVRLLLMLAAEAERDGWALRIAPSEPVRRIVCLLGLERQLLSERSGVHGCQDPVGDSDAAPRIARFGRLRRHARGAARASSGHLA